MRYFRQQQTAIYFPNVFIYHDLKILFCSFRYRHCYLSHNLNLMIGHGTLALGTCQAGVMTSVFSDEERETITDLNHTIICPVSQSVGPRIRDPLISTKIVVVDVISYPCVLTQPAWLRPASLRQ